MPVVAGPGPPPAQGLPDPSAAAVTGGGAGRYSRWGIGGAPRTMPLARRRVPAWKVALGAGAALAAVLWLRRGA